MRQFTFTARSNLEMFQYFRKIDCKGLGVTNVDFQGNGLTVVFEATNVDDISQLQTDKTRVQEMVL